MNIWLVLSYLVVLTYLFTSTNAEGSFRERAKKFCNLVKKCKKRTIADYEYGDVIKISDIPGIQPIGYVVRIPIYVLASRNAHIRFSEDYIVYLNRDDVYEFVIGAGENNQTIIRRRRHDWNLIVAETNNVLRNDEPLKLLIEISTAGVIKVFIEHQKEPLAVVVEKNPLPIQYIGFASKDNSLATFFYDCEGEHTYGEEDFKDMCQYAQAYEVGDTDFYKITDIPGSRSEEFILNFPFFVKTGRDARILLTKEAKVGYNDADYNFLIGGWENSMSQIQQERNNLRDIKATGLLSRDKFIQFVIQITIHGDLRLFRREDSGSYELIGEATDENPTLIEYISFGSWHNNLVQFYFNCSFSSDTPSVSVATGNLLLRDKIPPRLTLTNFLITKCNYYTIAEYDYKKFIKISDMETSHVGYNLHVHRIVLYIQGERAHILLSTSDYPNYETDFVYEFDIGGLDVI